MPALTHLANASSTPQRGLYLETLGAVVLMFTAERRPAAERAAGGHVGVLAHTPVTRNVGSLTMATAGPSWLARLISTLRSREGCPTAAPGPVWWAALAFFPGLSPCGWRTRPSESAGCAFAPVAIGPELTLIVLRCAPPLATKPKNVAPPAPSTSTGPESCSGRGRRHVELPWGRSAPRRSRTPSCSAEGDRSQGGRGEVDVAAVAVAPRSPIAPLVQVPDHERGPTGPLKLTWPVGPLTVVTFAKRRRWSRLNACIFAPPSSLGGAPVSG